MKSDVFGVCSCTSSKKMMYDSRMVIPTVIFSPLSLGNQNMRKATNERRMVGVAMFNT